jgi:hypothetical protein
MTADRIDIDARLQRALEHAHFSLVIGAHSISFFFAPT